MTEIHATITSRRRFGTVGPTHRLAGAAMPAAPTTSWGPTGGRARGILLQRSGDTSFTHAHSGRGRAEVCRSRRVPPSPRPLIEPNEAAFPPWAGTRDREGTGGQGRVSGVHRRAAELLSRAPPVGGIPAEHQGVAHPAWGPPSPKERQAEGIRAGKGPASRMARPAPWTQSSSPRRGCRSPHGSRRHRGAARRRPVDVIARARPERPDAIPLAAPCRCAAPLRTGLHC